MKNGFSFFPDQFSLNGWNYVFSFGEQLIVSYQVTIFITVAGLNKKRISNVGDR